MQKIILEHLQEAAIMLQEFLSNNANIENINKASEIIANAAKNKQKTFSCGNGGSMCDAMHFAEELTGRFRQNRRALPAVAISDSSHITCVANDFGFDEIFAKYLEANAIKGDVLLAISTSGNSKNVLKATKIAKELEMQVILLTGNNQHNDIAEYADIMINTPKSAFADRVQEIHIKIIHILIDTIEKRLNLQ